MLFGDNSNGYFYIPDRSRDVDRYNPSTQSNYKSNTSQYGFYDPTKSYYPSNNTGYYDGAGRYHR